jgi:hypothetical protein
MTSANINLGATTLTNYCYQYMFYGCSSLVDVPALPAVTLINSCYYGMFYGCSSLVNAPQLPASTLVATCYAYMFTNCTALADIYAKRVSYQSSSLTNWLSGVNGAGTFHTSEDSTWDTGGNGIPANFIRVNDYQ